MRGRVVDGAAYKAAFVEARRGAVVAAAAWDDKFAAAGVTCAALHGTKELRVWADGARLVRPVWALACAAGRAAFAAGEHPDDVRPGLESGALELVDASCTDDAGFVLALTPSEQPPGASHGELHPSLHLGIVAASIPFAHHHQATRNGFQTQQAKQAAGIPHAGCLERPTRSATMLVYPQLPLVLTKVRTVIPK